MTPEKLLEALTDVDDKAIMEATEPFARQAVPLRGRKLVVLAAAVITLLAMTVTAFASEEISGWFQNFFARNAEEALTTEQIEYLVENEQAIADAQTQDGYTLELKSAITDGTIAYITLHVTAPEDVVLSKTTIEGYDPDAPTLTASNWGTNFLTDSKGDFPYGACGMSTLEDYDGLDNTQDLLITVNPSYDPEGAYPFDSGTVWNLHFEDLIARYTNAAYLKEVQEQYPSDTDVADEVDESALWPEVKLAEGTWDFTITFGDCDFREIELITEPVTTSAVIGWRDDNSDVTKEVTITSFTLRSLSATIICDYDTGAPDFTNRTDKLLYVVMKDGSRIELQSSSGSIGTQSFDALTPIILDDVDYVLLADGTKLPMS